MKKSASPQGKQPPSKQAFIVTDSVPLCKVQISYRKRAQRSTDSCALLLFYQRFLCTFFFAPYCEPPRSFRIPPRGGFPRVFRLPLRGELSRSFLPPLRGEFPCSFRLLPCDELPRPSRPLPRGELPRAFRLSPRGEFPRPYRPPSFGEPPRPLRPPRPFCAPSCPPPFSGLTRHSLP